VRLRQAAFYFFSGKDEKSMKDMIEGADVVINMVRHVSRPQQPQHKRRMNIHGTSGAHVSAKG
jgi:hypothetical protein